MRRLATIGATTIVAASAFVLMVLGMGPRTGMYRTLTVLSGSMEPQIQTGAVIFVTPKPVSEIKVGDVLTFQIPDADSVVTHRVMELNREGGTTSMITKGDANTAPDPWNAIITDDTAWEVRASVPGLGWVIRFMRSPLLKTITVWVVPGLLAGVYLADIWRRKETPCEA